MQMVNVVDLSHHNEHVDFGSLKAAGVTGVILKATQGVNGIDPTFTDRYPRAVSVFGHDCVHVYHFLDNADAAAQMKHFEVTTPGIAFRWLDYEVNPNGPSCTLGTAIAACHMLATAQGKYPGMYGSDEAELGEALDAGHFTVCPLWIARYRSSPAPDHKCVLWQYDEHGVVAGMSELDLSTYTGKGTCANWFTSLALKPV